MKKSIILLLLSTFLFNGFAQFTPKVAGKANFARFLKSRTYFVLTGDAKFDNAFKKAVEKNWTITKYRFVNEEEFKEKSKDLDKSFVYLKKLKKEGVLKLMKVLCLVNGGQDDFVTYLRNTLAYMSVDNEGVEKENEDIIFRLGNMIYQLQDIVKIMQEKDFKAKNNLRVIKDYIEYYNMRTRLLKEKTLLIDKKYLNNKIRVAESIKKIYGHDIKFVETKEIERAIKLQDDSKAFLTSALNLYKINYVTDCATGEVLYVDFVDKNKADFTIDPSFSDEDVLNLSMVLKFSKR